MVEILNPRYQPPHKNYFSRIAIPYYMRKHELLCKKMKEESLQFSATADLWSSCTSAPYLCFTVHYICSERTLDSHCLQVHYTPHLQDALSTTLQECNLDEKNLVAIITDSGSNSKLACHLLKYNHLSCFSHNLDLAINKGLNDPCVDWVLSLCQEVVATLSYS